MGIPKRLALTHSQCVNGGSAAARRKDGMPVGTPFQPGQSDNPAGRAKGSVSVKAELQKLMDIVIKGELNPLTDLPEDMPVGRKIALNLALAAVADNKLDAIKTVIEHLDGKPAQALNLGGQEDNHVDKPGSCHSAQLRSRV